MSKNKHLENVALIAAAAIAVIAPFYFVYKLFKKSVPLVKDASFYDLDESQKLEFKKVYPHYLKLAIQHDKNIASGLRMNTSGDFDRRSKAGQDAQSIKSQMELLQPVIDQLTLYPRMMFGQAVSDAVEKSAAICALVVFAIIALSQIDGEAGSKDSVVISYILGGLVSIPVFFIGKFILKKVIATMYEPYQPDIVNLDSIADEERIQDQTQTQDRSKSMDIIKPNASANKERRNDMVIAAIYYLQPAIWVIKMGGKGIGDGAKTAMFSDLQSKGWQHVQVEKLYAEANKVFGNKSIEIEGVRSKCLALLSDSMLADSLQLAFYAACKCGELDENQTKTLLSFTEGFGFDPQSKVFYTENTERYSYQVTQRQSGSANAANKVDIRNPNAPERKPHLEQLAKTTIYYIVPSVFVGMMDNAKMSKKAMEFVFSDLVDKGWSSNQIKMLMDQALKLFLGDQTVEVIAARCKQYLTTDLQMECMKTALLVASEDGNFSGEEINMLETFFREFGFSAEDIHVEEVAK